MQRQIVIMWFQQQKCAFEIVDQKSTALKNEQRVETELEIWLKTLILTMAEWYSFKRKFNEPRRQINKTWTVSDINFR